MGRTNTKSSYYTKEVTYYTKMDFGYINKNGFN